jgi:hypothetical protein
VLIHDMTGTTRAPLVAAAWLVAAHGASPQAALMACAARRPGVAPKAADVRVLAAFAEELSNSPGGGAEFAAAGRRQQQLLLQLQQQAPGMPGQQRGTMAMMMGQQQQQQQQQNFLQQWEKRDFFFPVFFFLAAAHELLSDFSVQPSFWSFCAI